MRGFAALAETIRKNCRRSDRDGADWPAKVQRALREVWQFEQAARVGTRAGDRKFAGKKPDCPRALSDQFADARVIEQSLLRHGRKIDIEQRTKAESDIAVAAASILAREGVHQLAGAPREGARFAPGARSVCERERDQRKSWWR